MKAQTFTKLILLFSLSCCSLSEACAQAAKFGKIDEAELAMRSYEKDTSAAAVILSDYGYSRFNLVGELQVVTERHIRIKILKKSGYDWANVSIPYYQHGSTRDRVTSIKGFTYNLENGKVQKEKLDTKAVFDEQRNEYWHMKKLTMPNVQEGSVIDVSYTVSSDRVYNLREWEFQTTIPTVWSEYRAQIPQYFDYRFQMQGYHPLHKSGKESQNGIELVNNAYVWVMKDVPALKEENYITTLSDYQSKIEFELQQLNIPGKPSQTMTGSWSKVTDDLLADGSFGTQLNRSGFFKEDLAAISAKYKDPTQQMQAIYELVKSRMKWNEKYGIYTGNPIRKAYELRQGSAAEINLLLTSMLLEAGLDAGPVLVSTREHGRVYTSYSPMINKFNYVIAHVNVGGKEYLLDATDPLLPAGMLPFRCLNGSGRLIKKADQRWVDLIPTASYTRLYNANITINEQGELKGTGHESTAGYKALYLRKTILDEGESKFAERIAKEVGDYKLTKPEIKHLREVDKALDITFNISASGSGQANHMIYLNPMLGQAEEENPFKLNERQYPVDFGTPVDETYICRFTIPEGYELDEIPKGLVLNLPDKGGRFMYMVQQEGSSVQVMSKLNIAKPIFFAPEYALLKEFYNQIISKQAEQIVLKKIAAN